MVYLIDKKLVPGIGIFRFQVLTPEEFINVLTIAIENDELDCRIMDPQSVNILKEVTSQAIPLCPLGRGSEEINLETKDALIMVNIIEVQPIIEKVANDAPPNQGKVSLNVIIAYHFNYTPESMVACVLDTQIASKIPKEQWFRHFRDELVKQIPEPTDEQKTTNLQIV